VLSEKTTITPSSPSCATLMMLIFPFMSSSLPTTERSVCSDFDHFVRYIITLLSYYLFDAGALAARLSQE
jgi:hypothetical protein